MSKPFTPKDAQLAKPSTPKEAKRAKTFPKEVIDSFNELIAKHLRHGCSTFEQKEVVALIEEKIGKEQSELIFENNWLDVEPIFEATGWDVTYNGPAYCETFAATYTFKAKRKFFF